ncbi:TPA: hypothetical protein DIC20_02690 [Candidatus Dependentiae bacterium]|nr:MAG: Nucleotide-binding protein implicated in inhibition of septum formation [candidate division TM6 bacterium GW2011_GWF2_36_131]KKQ02375.1 MAG: Nucleotide-binding protein implicated in inhibition of septum formation [candidate division TM6 bacterium GW2011_GWE2_36_25]KKQ18654.1 MAG: Nucleotide-binding protein implicated in inhibition of septum formation [candidate division TM6 bacterium GW2011_GWA2_36_9]HBR70968.1 hypothetical protein [Candidatus Dependentiae bacterium]HCU00587.1 hypotheti
MNNKLYLASQSVQRKRLLQEAGFDFEILDQCADERSCDWGMPMQKLTEHIALLKMNSTIVPTGKNVGEACWVITADSLCVDKHGEIFGQPADHADAIRMVKAIRDGAVAGTAFCIDKRAWNASSWQVEKRFSGYAQGECFLDVSDESIEWYFDQLKKVSGLNYMKLAGAFSITGFGAQFLKRVDGSYLAILGLPMYEVRQALVATGFFD